MLTLSNINCDFYKSSLNLLNQLIFRHQKAYIDVDGTYFDFGTKLDANLDKIYRLVKSGRYHFSPYKHKTVRVKNKTRDLYIASWPDRFVEKWLSVGLNKLLNKWFSNNSYAYRIGKFGLDKCQSLVARSLRSDLYIIRRDISNYFNSISHDILIDKLSGLIDQNDNLWNLLIQRVKFEHTDGVANIGVPFGSPIACVFANIYLTNLDHELEKLPVSYFRYADDFIIFSDSESTILEAQKALIANIDKLQLSFKPSHTQNITFNNEIDGFVHCNKFKFLGIEFTKNGSIRLGVEKQRKIVNLFKRELSTIKTKINKLGNLDDKIKLAVEATRSVLDNRIRSAAIIDYYIKHINDEKQLRDIDMLIAKQVISIVLNKKFRYRDFSKIPYKKLRKAGLTSLVHRNRLHRQGHLHINFLSLRNDLTIKRYIDGVNRRKQRIEQIALAHKLKQY